MSQDSIVIFRSYIDAIAELPAELYKEVSRVLYAYAFDGIEPDADASPTARAMFIALKSQIDFNIARYERARKNGSKGGAPKGTRNNPGGRRGKRTNQELTETNQELTENKPKTNQDGEKELTDVKELTLISNQLSINNYVVVDNAREVCFLERFFAPENQYSIDVLCMQNHTDRAKLEQYAGEIIAEWQLRGVEHTDYKDAAQHLINHLRRKFEADRRAAREEAAAPKSRTQARADLIAAARNNLAAAIVNDGQPPRVDSAANDTKPF